MTPFSSAVGKSIALIGPARAGKDYLLAHAGYKALSLADPMVDLAHRIQFGPNTGGDAPWDKTTPGFRRLLQTWGQWGRGHVDESYPVCAERLAWLERVRSAEYLGWRRDWRLKAVDAGRPRFWAEAAVERLLMEPEGQPVALSNLRFQADVDVVREYNIPVGLVYASAGTRRLRAVRAGDAAAPTGQYEASENLAEYLCGMITCARYDQLPTWVDFIVINDHHWLAEPHRTLIDFSKEFRCPVYYGPAEQLDAPTPLGETPV